MSQATPFEILFMDRPHNYPKLPTPDDIDGSEVLLHQSTGSRLVRMKLNLIMKYGIRVHPIEAHNMLFVAKSTTVPVPSVYAIYQRQEKQNVVTYILMQYVSGTTLLNLWSSLNQGSKTDIAMTLRTYLDQLRQLQHPGYFGNIKGGPPLDDMFLAMQGAHKVETSFATEEELIKCIIQNYDLETGERMAHKTRYYQHVLPTILRGDGSPRFTHNDFQRKNIIVQPDGAPVIIDWEFASWFPIYWEYSTAIFSNSGWNDDWHEYVQMVLDEYPGQCIWLSTMKLEMWS